MEITPELANLFGSEPDKIESVEITYQNGGKVIGTIMKLRLSPLRIVIQKSVIEKRERPKHKAVFEHVTKMQLSFKDGIDKVFQ